MSDTDIIDNTDTLIEDVHETPAATPNFRTELATRLSELVPEAIADGKVDVEKLKELLDDDVADSSERFGLFWPGKKRALRAAQEPTTATLKPDFENSKDWGTTKNVFIEGDNLEVLKILQKHYHAKIKMIYIDPPYNTGKDFIYPDNYKEGLDTYLEWTRQVNEDGKKLSTNVETEGRYHSNWLNMMYPRLKLARNLLTDDGFIFISIDDNELDNLKKVCSEIFGEHNFQGDVITVSNPGGRDYRQLAVTNEHLLIYSRSGNSVLNEIEKQVQFPLSDGRGGFELRELRNRNPKFHRGNRPNLFYPFYVDPSARTADGYCSVSLTLDETHTVAVLPRNSEGRDSCWRWGMPKSGSAIVPGDPYSSEVVARQKRGGGWNIYEKNRRSTTKVKSVWDETEMRTEEGTRLVRRLFGATYFDHPKPIALIKRCLEIGSIEGDIVLDFFAGSATLGHAVMELAFEGKGMRRHIEVQLPEPTQEGSAARQAGYATISEIARKRLELAAQDIARMADDQSSKLDPLIDCGFRSYTLTDTHFSKWRISSDVEEDALQKHLLSFRDSATGDATVDELLTEILLKQGYSLTAAVSTAEVGGLDVRIVRDGDGDVAVLAYLNDQVKPKLEQLRALLEEAPTRIIVLEDVFQGDDELKTNLAQLCKSKSVEFWTA